MLRLLGATCVAPRFRPAVGFVVFITFLVVQALDGALTYLGVERFGAGAEGNVLLSTAIHAWGPGPALVSAKLLGSACGLVLFTFSVYRVLLAAAGAYLALAVLPWVFALT